MADQTVYFASSISGDATNPNNAVGSGTGTWAGGPINSGTSWIHQWGLTNPTENQLRAELQTITLWLRKGTNSGNPTIVVRVLRDGAELANSGSRTISSSTGQGIQVSWTPTAGESSQGISVEIACTAAGGSPGVRNSVEIDYAWLVAKTQAGATLTPVSKTVEFRYTTHAAVEKTLESRYNVAEAAASLTPVTKTLESRYNVRAAVTDTLESRYNVAAGGGGDPAAYVNSSRSAASDSLGASNTCPVPAGAAVGMTAFLALETYIGDAASGPITPTWPTGFEHMGQIVGGGTTSGVALYVAKKQLTAADSGNYVTTWSGSRWNQSNCVLVDNAATISTLGAANFKGGEGTAIDSLTVDTSNAPVLIQFVANQNGTSHNPPTGFTERQEGDYISTATSEPGSPGQYTSSGATIGANSIWAAALIAVEGGAPSGLTPVTKTLESRFNIRAGVTDQLDSRFNVRVGVGDTLETRFHDRAAVTDTVESRFNVRSAVADTLESRYGVREAVSDVLDTRFNVRVGVGDVLETRFHVRAPVTKTLGTEWNVASAILAVQKNLESRFNVRAGVADQLESRFHVRIGVGDTLESRFHNRVAITDTLESRWGVRAGVLDQLDTRFNVLASVTKTLGTAWNTREAVSTSLAIGWNVQAEVGEGLVLYKRVNDAWTPVTLRRRVDGAWV